MKKKLIMLNNNNNNNKLFKLLQNINHNKLQNKKMKRRRMRKNKTVNSSFYIKIIKKWKLKKSMSKIIKQLFILLYYFQIHKNQI